jgi:predicted AlkP superfamily phosphohydrolase/phosphomutase
LTPGAPLVVIGWDGATWDLLEAWVRQGKLPNLARMMAAGVSGRLRSTALPLSPAAWSTILTGQNPGKHGIFDWFERREGSYAVEYVHTGRLGAAPLWHYINQAGRRVGVFCPPMLYPAVPVEGFIVSGMAAPNPRSPGFSFPEGLLAQLESAAGPFQTAETGFYQYGREAEYLQAILDWLETQRRAIRFLVNRYPCDVYLLVFMQSDHAQHKFWRYLDADFPGYDSHRDAQFQDAILRVYQALDDFLGELLGIFGDQANILVLSDHGAGPTHGILFVNRWLQQQGWLCLKRTPGTWLKLALARSNLIPTAGRLAARLGLGWLANLASKPARDRMVRAFLTLDDIDWKRTRAYARGAFGQIFVNLKGREPQGIVSPGQEYEELVAQVISGLGSLRHPESGAPLITRLHRRDEVFHGPFVERSADILFSIQDYLYQSSVSLGLESPGLLGKSEYQDSGSHRPEGILVMYGPEILAGAGLPEASVADILPTLLALAGLPLPAGLDGRPLIEAFSHDLQSRLRSPAGIIPEGQSSPGAGELADRLREAEKATDGSGPGRVEPVLSHEELQQLEERLRNLGYLG